MPTAPNLLLSFFLRRGGGGRACSSSLLTSSRIVSSLRDSARGFSTTTTATEEQGEGEEGDNQRRRRRRRRSPSSSTSSWTSSSSSSSSSVPYPSFVPLSPFQRAALAVAASIGAALDPKRADLVAAAGEATGSAAFASAARRMARSPTGRRLLSERPRVTDETLRRARECGKTGTFGEAYARFMESRGFLPSERPAVRFVEEMEEEEVFFSDDDDDNHDDEKTPSSSSSREKQKRSPFLLPRDAAAYAATRSRECHDFWHVLFGCKTTVLGELALKGVEFAQLGLPSAGAAVAGASWRLKPEDRRRLVTQLVPWAARAGSRSADLLCLYYEEHFGENLEELRMRWRIETAPSKKDEPAARWRRPGAWGAGGQL